MSLFVPNIPRPTDLLSDSQADLLSNNGALNATFSRNHVALDVATNNGKHTFVEMPLTAGIPNPTPALSAGSGTLYTFAGVNSTDLAYTPDTGLNGYALTRCIDSAAGTFSAANPGWTFLPGGMLLQWGTGIVSAKGTATTFTFATPFTGIPFSITIGNITDEGNSPGENNQFIKDGTVTNTNFKVVNSSSSSTKSIYYMAIGK